MMTRVDEMEFQPLIDGEGAENRVIEDLRGTPEAPTRFRRGGIEPVEVANDGVQRRAQIELAGWNDVLRRLTSCRKIAKAHDRETLQGLFECPGRRNRLPFFEASLEALRAAQVGALQMLDDFGHRPFAGITASVALGTSAARGVFDNRQTRIEMWVHGPGMVPPP